jgi:hypothetical protein
MQRRFADLVPERTTNQAGLAIFLIAATILE